MDLSSEFENIDLDKEQMDQELTELVQENERLQKEMETMKSSQLEHKPVQHLQATEAAGMSTLNQKVKFRRLQQATAFSYEISKCLVSNAKKTSQKGLEELGQLLLQVLDSGASVSDFKELFSKMPPIVNKEEIHKICSNFTTGHTQQQEK